MRHFQCEVKKKKTKWEKKILNLRYERNHLHLEMPVMPIAKESLEPGLLTFNEKNPKPDGILKSNLTLFVSPTNLHCL